MGRHVHREFLKKVGLSPSCAVAQTRVTGVNGHWVLTPRVTPASCQEGRMEGSGADLDRGFVLVTLIRFLCVCGWMFLCRCCVRAGLWGSQDSVFSYHEGPEDQMQVIRLGAKCFYLLSYLSPVLPAPRSSAFFMPVLGTRTQILVFLWQSLY